MTTTQLKLSPDEVGRIVGFLGYGNPDASVWFIGIEEGIGKMTDADVVHNLRARGQFSPTMDLYEAHLKLREKGQQINIETNPPKTQVWQYMTKIMLARRARFDPNNRAVIGNYVSQKLGRLGNETFLTELRPIPQHAAHQKIGIETLRPFDPDIDKKIEARRQALKKKLAVNSSSRLVICYGNSKQRADEFARLLDVEWESVAPNIKKANNSRHLLLPFFGNGWMSHQIIHDLHERGLLKDES